MDQNLLSRCLGREGNNGININSTYERRGVNIWLPNKTSALERYLVNMYWYDTNDQPFRSAIATSQPYFRHLSPVFHIRADVSDISIISSLMSQ